MEYYGTAFNASAFNDFISARGRWSDMLGYLNFSDEDIYYRKSRVSMSFIRLSFYSSPDPIEQKLLYYSTSFLDATSLYGKYMKQYVVKSEEEDDGLPIVFYDNNIVSARLDTEIVIRNEYQSEKSSEGFNLYLFADDADGVNSERTIYMKVEFNHAGNGKTIPMIMWPKSGGSYKALTADNFMDSLYIPIKIGYINGKYVYSIPDAEVEGNNLRLILFEPKLDYFAVGDNESDTGYEEVEYNSGRRENTPTRRTPISVIPKTDDDGESAGQGGTDGEQEPWVQPTDTVPWSDEGGSSIINFPSKSGKKLYFGAYSVNTFYGKRISLPAFLTYPDGRPVTPGSNAAAYSIQGNLKIESDNPSVIDILKDNYTGESGLYDMCDDKTLPCRIHITPKRIKGTGTATIKVSLLSDPQVYDTCIVNVSNINNNGKSVSQFSTECLVFPWVTYVKKNTFFDIWCHKHNIWNGTTVEIDDTSAITMIGLGPEESVGYTLQEAHQSFVFKSGNKVGTFHIYFSHKTYSGKYAATVHVIDE
jgi:hypothetical protein